jgi:hypothetical protein
VNAGIGANVAPRINAGVAPRVNAGVGANVAPRVNAGIGANVPGTIRSNVGANLGANAGANARTALRPNTGVNANSGIRANAGLGDIRTNVNSALNARVNSPIRSNILPGVNANTGAGIRANVPGVTNARVGANAAVDGRGRVNNFLGIRNGVNAGANLNARQSLHPSWFNAGVNANSRLHANLGRTLGTSIRLNNYNYLGANVGRANYWGRYGVGVNNYWRGNNRYPYFNNRWWAGRYIYRPFGYFNYWGFRPWGYWWGSPGWIGVNNWYGGWGGGSGYGWSSPYYYDYGPGGNVVYQNGNVYVDGTNVGTAEEYAQSAAALAAVDPAEVPSQQTEDWLGLGTFAVVETADGDKDKVDAMEPTRFVQLAVDKNGFVTGTFYNKKTDEVYSLSGRVDKDTQRVAFAVDNNKDIVFETGIYNLTQDQTPVLVHLGPNKSETFVFVRLEKPDEPAAQKGSIDQLP